MSKVIVVTDSSPYLPQSLVEQYGIHVIPLTLQWNGQVYRDGVDIQPTEFYNRLAESETLPTTSQLNNLVIEQEFNTLLDQGYEILTLFISSGLSATHQSALQAKSKFKTAPIEVLDSQTVSIPLALMVLETARAAQAGASLAECKAAAESAFTRQGVYFTVETLKYLHMGGRIGGAKRLLGTALDIKPILEIRDGLIMPKESVISRKKAFKRMMMLTEKSLAGRKAKAIGMIHAADLETAQELLDIAVEQFHPETTVLTDVSPVVGSHTGRGTIAMAYLADEK